MTTKQSKVASHRLVSNTPISDRLITNLQAIHKVLAVDLPKCSEALLETFQNTFATIPQYAIETETNLYGYISKLENIYQEGYSSFEIFYNEGVSIKNANKVVLTSFDIIVGGAKFISFTMYNFMQYIESQRDSLGVYLNSDMYVNQYLFDQAYKGTQSAANYLASFLANASVKGAEISEQMATQILNPAQIYLSQSFYDMSSKLAFSTKAYIHNSVSLGVMIAQTTSKLSSDALSFSRNSLSFFYESSSEAVVSLYETSASLCDATKQLSIDAFFAVGVPISNHTSHAASSSYKSAGLYIDNTLSIGNVAIGAMSGVLHSVSAFEFASEA